MYVFMYVCVCMYVCMCVYVCMYVCMSVDVCMYVCVYVSCQPTALLMVLFMSNYEYIKELHYNNAVFHIQ